MTINRNSWHYNVFAWTFSPMHNRFKGEIPPVEGRVGNRRPRLVNLCAYWRRVFVVAPLIIAGLTILIIFVLFVCTFILTPIYLLTVVFQFAIGRVPIEGFRRCYLVSVWNGESSLPMCARRFHRYESFVRIRLYDIYPVTLLGIAAIGCVTWRTLPYLMAVGAEHSLFFASPRWLISIVSAGILVSALILLFSSDAGQAGFSLIAEFIKSKKAKICPLIEFVGERPSIDHATQ